MAENSFKRLRELGASYWKPLLTLLASSSVVWDVSKLVGITKVQDPSSQYATYERIGIGLFVFIIIRFPRIAITITSWFIGSPNLPHPRRMIFRGPRPYSKQDSEVFPGREKDIDICWRAIKEQPFFILEGESGCGKSSLLNAGLLPTAYKEFNVIECRITDDPIGKSYFALLNKPYDKSQGIIDKEILFKALITAAGYDSLLGESSQKDKPALLLCFDQFEELFVTVRDEVRKEFLGILKDAISTGRVHVIIAIRSDFSDLLIGMCRVADPTQQKLNIGNYYTLRAFNERQARGVLKRIFEPLHEDDPLIKQRLEDFTNALIRELLLPPRDRRLFHDDEKSVLPVEMQTVGMMIESLGADNFSISGLKRQGGKAGLLRAFIEDAKIYVWRKTGVPSDKALLILRQLVSPARTKWGQSAESLARTLHLPVNQVKKVLEAFGDKYLVHQIPSDVNDKGAYSTTLSQYELMHEHLVQVLVEAPEPILQKARDAEEHLNYWVNRTKTVFNSDETQGENRLVTKARLLLAQPIPIIESIRLWRFVRSGDEQWMLKRNLLGFCMRMATLALPLILLITGWMIWINTDKYQIKRVMAEAPVTQAAAGGGYSSVLEWIRALAYLGEAQESMTAASNVKGNEARSNAYAIAAEKLALIGKKDDALTALQASLSIKGITWEESSIDNISRAIRALSEPRKSNEMLTIIRGVQDDKNRISALGAVSRGLYKAGITDRAKEVLDEALAVTDGINDKEKQCQILINLAKRSVKDGILDEAKKPLNKAWGIARTFNEAGKQVTVLVEISYWFAKASETDDALKVFRETLVAAASIPPSSYGSNLDWLVEARLSKLATEIAKAGKAHEVFIFVRDSNLKSNRDEIFSAIMNGFAKAGNINESLSAAREIKDGNTRFIALTKIIDALVKIDNNDEARRIIKEALEVPIQFDKNIEMHKLLDSTASLVRNLFKLGEKEKAVAITIRAERLTDSIEGIIYTNANHPAAILAKELAISGNIDEAISVAKSTEDLELRYRILSDVTVETIKTGKDDEIKKTLNECLISFHNIPNFVLAGLERDFPNDEPGRRAKEFYEPLANIIKEFAKVGKINEALNIAQYVKISDSYYQILTDTSLELAKSDKVAEALNIVNGFVDKAWQSHALAALAVELAEENKGEQAYSIALEIQYSDDRSVAFAAIAKWWAHLKFFKRARLNADLCSSAEMKLSANSVILLEYAKDHNPDIVKLLEVDDAARKKTPTTWEDLVD
jgi:hypothetical protein